MAIIKKPMKKANKWPKICLYISIALILFAIGLYIYLRHSISSEFGYAEDFYGESFDELYSLSTIDSDISEPILKQGKAALSFIGTEDSCEAYGEFSRYCINLAHYPEASKVDTTLELIAGGMERSSGYLWVAYTQHVYDASGALLTSKGAEDARILSRWKIEKINGAWTVTEILEML